MAEDFVDFMSSINGKSTKEKLDILIDVVEKTMTIFVNFIEITDNKIILLEESIKQIKIDIQYVPDPYVKKPFIRTNNESAKATVLKELKELFKKKKDMENIKSKIGA